MQTPKGTGAKRRSDRLPPEGPKGKTDHPLGFSEWGNLPPDVIEVLRGTDKSHFPAKYRAMLEEYYKRLADTGGR